MTLVDTNVLLDLLNADPVWKSWSETQLHLASLSDHLAINAVIYAELSAYPGASDAADTIMLNTGMSMAAFSKASARLAEEAFAKYRKRKGAKTGVLADFFIGAQAQAEGWRILTRDKSRYQTYFPNVHLIAPA